MSYRLGFLLCDHALAHLAERFGDYPEMFERAFAEVSDAIDWDVYDVTAGELPVTAETCDGYLISGSRHGAYDDLPWIAPLEAFLRRASNCRPVVGLCFGHQVLGQALGGEVAKSDRGWGLGIRPYEVMEAEPWMNPPRDSFIVPVCHQDQVVRLPPGARRVARSPHCENFVVRYDERAIGIQGHPEFSPEFVSALVDWRREGLPEDVYADARASLASAHDNATVKRWILRFLGIPTLPDAEAEA